VIQWLMIPGRKFTPPPRRERLARAGFAGVLMALLGAALCLLPLGDGLRLASYDLPHLFGGRGPAVDVVIVAIDERSYGEHHLKWGREPFDRALLAQMLRLLKQAECPLVVFDMVFAEPGPEAADAALAQALREHGRVVLAADVSPVLQPGLAGQSIHPPLERFREAAATWGVSGLFGGAAGVQRLIPPGTNAAPSLAWAAATLAGAPITRDAAQRDVLRWIRYYGPPGTMESMSFSLALGKPPEQFRGKTVFIGGKPATRFAGETVDTFATPHTRWGRGVMAGVEIHATIFANLMEGRWLTRMPDGAALLLTAALGLVFGFGLCLLRPGRAALAVLTGMAVVTAAALMLFLKQGVWFPWLALVVVVIPAAWLCSLLTHVTRLARERTALERQLETARAQASTRVEPMLPPRPRTPPPAGVPAVPDHDLLRRVGRGAYGEVWLARNAVGLLHAVKLVRREQFRTDAPYAREFRGIQNYMPVSRRHPGLVQILHVGRNDAAGYFYYVMEAGDDRTSGPRIDPASYEPRTLAGELHAGRRLPLDQCLAWGISLAEALHILHEHGLIHRDIKPANLIFVEGQPKLADIGLVTHVGEPGGDVSDVGTFSYRAPEGPGTTSSDVYSLGKVIFEAAMGTKFPELPASMTDTDQTAGLLRINSICLRACDKDSARRFQSSLELRAALLELQEQQRKASLRQ
jgi:CHASE2 domain-containing sensor protein